MDNMPGTASSTKPFNAASGAPPTYYGYEQKPGEGMGQAWGRWVWAAVPVEMQREERAREMA
jgi:hypothetical protein